jgi:hypothetical protein
MKHKNDIHGVSIFHFSFSLNCALSLTDTEYLTAFSFRLGSYETETSDDGEKEMTAVANGHENGHLVSASGDKAAEAGDDPHHHGITPHVHSKHCCFNAFLFLMFLSFLR